MDAQTFFTQKLETRIIYTEKPLNILCTTKHAQSTSQCYFVLQSLHKERPSTTLYYKACTKNVPVLLCTTKHAQSTSQHYFVLLTKFAQSTPQYYFVLQSLHKARPSTICTTKFAQSTSQYYLVLQSLHKAHPSTTLYILQSLHAALAFTTLYYKACTKYSPVPLCTPKFAQSTSQYYFVLLTKLAQSTPQYYFVLQSLQRARLSTTLYCKACTNVLQSLHEALPSSTLYYKTCTSTYFALRRLHKHIPVHCVTHQQAFIHSKLLHRDAFTPRSF